jgi:hypothetical protein
MDTNRWQVFGLIGAPTIDRIGFLPAIASRPEEQCLMTAFVPKYRYGLAPESNRVPSFEVLNL